MYAKRRMFAMTARRFLSAVAAFALPFLLSGVVLAAPLLKLGSEGHDVRILQENLRRLGYDVELSEIFDNATQNAVLAFQRDEGLTASGTVNRETWRALKARTAASQPPEEKQAQPVKEKTTPEQATPAEKPTGKSAPAKTTEKPAAPSAEKIPENAPFLPKKKVDAIIRTAKKYTGTRYIFGGTTPKGFDCSGFVQYVFKQNGFAIPRTADEQYKLGKRVKKRTDLEPGDLVFFSTYEKGASHCGIYLGKNQFIHVSSSKGVRVDSLDDSYWKPRWHGGKHIVKK